MRKFVQFKFVKFKKRVKHPWKSITFSKVAGKSNTSTKSNTSAWEFLHFLYYEIAHSVSYDPV